MAEKQQIGNAELWLGDAGEVLPLLGDFDLLLTDPPYGLGEKLQGGTWGENNAWDQTPVDCLLLDVARAHCTKHIIWGGNYYALPPTRGWLTWFKPDAVPSMASFEMAWTNIDMNARQLRHSIAATNAERCGHPTQKPVRVMEWSLTFWPAETVLDAFMGSGTTGVACANLGKRFVGIERERRYFDMACERIHRAQAQERLFA